MKNKRGLLLTSALILAGGITLGMVTSCGVDYGTTMDFIVENEGDISLDLDDSFVVEAEDSKYFSPYVVDSEGELITNGGDSLLSSGQSAKLLAYWVPEGYTLSAKVDGSCITLSKDGTISTKDVSEKTTAKITLFAESPTAELTNKAGEEVNRVIKKSVNVSVIPSSQLAKSGILKYSSLTADQRSEITSQLEKFALKTGLTGVSLADNGGYAMYNSRVHSPLLDEDNYMAGYGFGTYMYGSISDPLAGETTEAYKYYFHEQIDPGSDQGTINQLNSDRADVGDMYDYMSTSYYTTELTSDYSAYEYIGSLARSNPEPLNLGEDGTATKWKVKVWVGGDADDDEKGIKKDFCFRTASSKYSSYDKKKITLSDYLTPFKLLASQAVGWYRGSEKAAEDTANRQIKGFAEFYNNSAEDKALPSDEEFSSKVGISLDESDNSIIFEFNEGFTEEYAIYQIDSYGNPMSEEFIKELGSGNVIEGAKLYGTSPSPLTPADTSLSVGPYYLESYDSKNLVTYKKNELWHIKKDSSGRDLYQIAGYHIKVNSRIDSDKTALMTAWENNEIDSATLLDEYWEKYENDSRKKSVKGTYQTKMTFNRMDKLLWDKYFGEGGTWYNKYNKGNYELWDVKPISSNDNFFYGLNLTVDREAFAAKYHVNPSYSYQNPVAKVNPVTGELYNNSEEHDNAVKYVYGNAFDDLSQTITLGVEYMQDGIIEEIEAGHYTLGSGQSPEEVVLGVGTINQTTRIERLSLIESDWQSAFNSAVASYRDADGDNPLVTSTGYSRLTFDLDIDAVASETSQAALITHGLWIGKYDIQFAYLITGNAYDTINNMNILKSNDFGGFELNFAVNTSLPSGDIYWDGKYWSFDTLWAACNGGTVLDAEGNATSKFIEQGDDFATVISVDDDGTVTASLPIEVVNDSLEWTLDESNDPCDVYNSTITDYTKCTAKKSDDGKSIIFTIPKDAYFDAAAGFGEEFAGYKGVYGYVYYSVTDGTNSADMELEVGFMFKI